MPPPMPPPMPGPKGPPMPPGGADMPPKGMDAKGLPAAPMSPDDIRKQVEGMLPDPKNGGYSYKKACNLVEKTNEAIAAISKAAGKDVPMEAPEPPKPEKGDLMPGRFPLDSLIPALTIADIATSLSKDPKYEVDVSGLVDDTAIDVLAAQVDQVHKDKKLLDAVKEATSGKEPDADEAGGPSDMDADNPPEKKPGAMAYA